nr:MAG TPA: hypothetical protein [Caudoviricetes sp.]
MSEISGKLLMFQKYFSVVPCVVHPKCLQIINR